MYRLIRDLMEVVVIGKLAKIALAAATGLLLLATEASPGGLFDWVFGAGVRGSGNLISENRDLPAFSKIHSSGAFDVTVEVGQTQRVQITYDDNLVALVETEVTDGTLEIRSRKSHCSRHECEIQVAVPDLDELLLTGSGDIVVENLNADRFRCVIQGSGDIRAEGRARELQIRVSGSGDIDARHLIAQDAFVRVSGSGDVDVFAAEAFEGRVSGSGDISYYGRPDRTSVHVSGSGDIKRR